MKPCAFLIVNPVAGRGEAARRARLRGGEAHFTEYPGHASELARAALEAGYRRIEVLGGDGTLHEAIQALAGVAPPDFEVVVLGGGTSCDFAKRPAFDGPVDILRIDCHDERGAPVRRYAVNASHIGFVAEATHRYNHPGPVTRVARRLGTDAGMVAAALGAIGPHRPFEVCVGTRATRLSNLVVFKTPWIGGGMWLGVPLEPDSGRAGAMLLEPCGGAEFLALIRDAYRGTLPAHAKVRIEQVAELSVSMACPLPVEADGESIGWTPACYTVLPRALRFVCGGS